MNRTTLRQKLTSWPKVAALCLLIVAGTLSVKLWPRTVPYEQCSDIYKKYAGTHGIEAAFVKDYKVNDTVLIDATVLEATTDSAWAVLQKDFNIPIIPKKHKEPSTCHSIGFRLAPKNNPQAPTDSNLLNNDLIVVSQEMQTITILHITSEAQIDIIIYEKAKEIHNKEYEN
ncbi:MAG: hypothetical protein MJZ77_06120 [Bacteroidales bacterium]|nr:hypothetical protein [Bacteroidales bacterium]